MRLEVEQRRGKRTGLQRLTPWLAIVVLVSIGYWSARPPAPASAAAPPDRFSAERAIDHVGVIAREPHPMGTAANAEVRAYIVARLKALGIALELQTVTVPDYYGGNGPVQVINIIGRIPGTRTTRAVALIAHYDTVPTTPGANDNTSAVAALLETGRALLAGPPLRNDVYFIFTDGEEPAPRFGATAFVTDHPAFENLGLVVNLEAAGGSGPSVLVETSGPEQWLVSELAIADPHPAAFSILTAITRLLGKLGTDFDAFRNAGVTGLHYAYLHGSPIYHTEADSFDAVTRGSLQHHGDHVLGISRHFGTLDLNEPRPANGVVCFTIRSVLIHYPATWPIPLALLALAIWSIGLWRARGDTGASASVFFRSLFRTLGAGILGVAAGTLLWLLISAVRATPGVVESYLYFGWTPALAVLVAARTAPGRASRGRLEVVLIWVALSLLTAFWLPGFSYLFSWPALAAAAALCWRTEKSGAPWVLRFSLVAAPTLILMTPAIDLFFQLAQPRPGNPDSEMKAAVVLPLLLALGTAGLLRTAWPVHSASHR